MKKKLIKLNKTFAIFSVILLLISGVLMSFSFTFAQTTLPGYTPMPDRITQTEVGLSPNFVGVGQEVTVNIITYPAPSGPTYEAQTLVPELHAGFEDITITIKHPDGYEETFMPIDETLAQAGIEMPGVAQIVGHLQFRYKPTKVGVYTFTGSFPGQFYTTDNQYEPAKLSVYFKPSSSTVPAKLTVQEDKVIEEGLLTGWPWSPLPENYWENPVQIDNREWAAISGDWTQYGYDIGGSNYNPYSTAPSSPHIVWVNSQGTGGLPGGIWGSLPYPSGSSLGATCILLDGKIYQSSRSGYFECVDLRTGEKLWEAPGSPNCAVRLDPAFQTASQHNEGFIDSWLWEGVGAGFIGPSPTTWKRYDPYDGDLLQTINNVPSTFRGIRYEDGSPFIFCVQADLSLWNTTLPLKLPYCNLIKWDYSKVRGNEWSTGIVWNVSIMQDDFVSIGDNNFHGPKVYPYWGADAVIVKTHNAMQIMAAYSYTTGAFLWKNNATVLNNDVVPIGIATSPSGPYIMHDAASTSYVAYDVRTGREIWRTEPEDLPWSILPSYEFVYHDGVHFIGSYDGHVYAYDTNTGDEIWQSDYTGEEWETIYGNQPFAGAHVAVGADGKLYFGSTTTYRMMPRPRLQILTCIDEFTGDFIWKLPMAITPVAIADGYLIGKNLDDQLQYCIGKGKTETTVSIQNDVIASGSNVLIKGTVMDMSPGAPNTPAVAETSMVEWMDYMYGQNATLINNPPMPDGVQVTLTAIDQNGVSYDIGTVTSDGTGMFKKLWKTPETMGEYTIFASFAGSESYWSSYGETALGVVEPTSPSGPIEPEPTPEHPIISTELAIAIGVIVVAVVATIAYVVYRRRK